MLRVIGTAIVTAVLTSAFWIWFYNSVRAGGDGTGRPRRATKSTVDPAAGPPVAIAEGVEVGPGRARHPGRRASRPTQLVDTFTQARAGGARVHDAIDIMAPTGTPVVAAAAGTGREAVLLARAAAGSPSMSARPTGAGSIITRICSAMRRALPKGSRSGAAQLIGRVGHTGNANPAGPHLHFAINRMEPGEKWWQGSADQSLSAACREKGQRLRPRQFAARARGGSFISSAGRRSMKISGVDIRPGNIIEYEGGIWRAVKIQHTQPGKGGAYMQVELKNLIDGRKNNVRFRSAETVERVRLDTKDFQFLFARRRHADLHGQGKLRADRRCPRICSATPRPSSRTAWTW